MDQSNLYQTELLDLAHHPQYAGVLDNPTHLSFGSNLSCGDEISWQAVLDSNSVIKTLRHQTRGCVICQAGAELIAKQAQGLPFNELIQLQEQTFLEQFKIPLSLMRQKCALLSLNSLQALKPVSEFKTDSNLTAQG